MCVIAYADEKRLTNEMVEQMWDRNSDGGGAAWREGEGADTEVVFEKGLTLSEMKVMNEVLPFPYVLHFRIASSGGVCPELTHPFPIHKGTNLDLVGRTKGNVLFHNGDWRDWKPSVLRAAENTGTPMPPGRKFSDTRAMAWLCSIYGPHWMDWIGEKGIVFGPYEAHFYYGSNGWKEINGVTVSNDYWEKKVFTQQASTPASSPAAGYCKDSRCGSTVLDASGFCVLHRPNPPVVVNPNGIVQVNRDAITQPKLVGAGGTQLSHAPFRQTRPLLTEEQAEDLFKNGRQISKQQLKLVRKYYDKIRKKKLSTALVN